MGHVTLGTPPPATPRHEKGLFVELPGLVSREHTLHIAAHVRHHLHPGDIQGALKRPRNGGADQRTHLQIRHLAGTILYILGHQADREPLFNAACPNLRDEQMARHIKHGRNAPLPIWDCDLHHLDKIKKRANRPCA